MSKGTEVFINGSRYQMDRRFEMRGVVVGEREDTYAVKVKVFRGEDHQVHIIPKKFCAAVDM